MIIRNTSKRRNSWISQCDVVLFQNHVKFTFPSEASVSLDESPYRNSTFHNVLPRQGSSFCNKARLNSQAFALHDMKMVARKGLAYVKR